MRPTLLLRVLLWSFTSACTPNAIGKNVFSALTSAVIFTTSFDPWGSTPFLPPVLARLLTLMSLCHRPTHDANAAFGTSVLCTLSGVHSALSAQ